ncbi:hypothetical protein [Corynebacterium sp. NML120713]|uniref:hypothetical protein n=1 Tax=Corynebacterium sp. NML120713 TaxID=1906332 RepID=UPI000918F32F|nr:hypothetical protein [Corynebacterium sp. NML120713]OIR42917.1 hypothetical protein BJP06_07910 [Corynebacterium sp. NML120713]
MVSAASNLNDLLRHLGRAATPPVRESNFKITLHDLIFADKYIQDSKDSILVITSRKMVANWSATTPFEVAMPGSTISQAKQHHIRYLLIDTDAFDQGPWISADSGGNRPLAQEIFDAGRELRAKGAIVYWLGNPTRPDQTDTKWLKSTATVDLHNIPEVDLEENAPQSDLWKFLVDVALEREVNK